MSKTKENAVEWLSCKKNPFYFFYNYVYIPEHATGGSIKITHDNLHPKMKRVVKSLYHYNKAILMASRQLGKSSIAACMIAWAMVFYPGIQVTILNMKKKAGLQNLSTVKFIINNLPSWMITNKPVKSKSEIVTYLDLYNDSHLDVFFPSTVHDSSTIARSLTVPILYIDEVAFIKDMLKIYGSAQQTLSKARQQAEAQGYPYFQFLTSTPNGTTGDGEWFYRRWQNCVDSDLIFDNEKWDTTRNINSIVNDPSKNSFIGIKYHWSEDPTKDDDWYRQQCQEIDDQRTINQELDLLFVGTQSCIFTDETLASFEAQKPLDTVETPNGANLNLFEKDLDPNDYYLIGCDTADSLEGAFCAIQIFSFKDFNQIAEVEHKYGSYTLFGQDIDFVFKWLLTQLNNDNIILCNENNTIGKAPIEYLVYHAEGVNYVNYLYKEPEPPTQNKNKKNKPIITAESGLSKHDKLGINTTGLTKPLMVGCLLECIKENSSGIKSQKLINQMSNIEKTNTGTVKSTGYNDLFMSACFCAYVRSKKAIEIMPILQTGNIENYKEKQIKDISNIIGLGNTKNLMKNQNALVMNDIEAESQGEIEEVFEDNDKQDFLPFFTM